ncbi:MAG: TetR/AcrR family transcriptional regulator [Gammaproteobacteria bacterium]|nr:TetR/AcrR family transcriptional regulator [Gammaproteobacteria bacterium]MCW9030616.1 TetR/AcrR family transcriptional regulator [Gammaproteobacteria bacterium]
MIKKRLSAEERRASILALSKGLFAQFGLHGVSVGTIAKACNVYPAVIYQHFPSKEALYEAVLNEYACKREEYIDVILSGPSDFANVLFRMTQVYVKSRLVDPDAIRIELHSALYDNKSTESLFINQWKGFTDYIEFSLEEMIDEKEIPESDIRLAGLLYTGLLREFIYTMGISREKHYSDINIDYATKELVNMFLRAVGIKPLNW